MSAPLKPCPFCGPGGSIVSLWHDDVAKRWRVGCGRCGCSTGTSARDTTQTPAIETWNTRPATGGVGTYAFKPEWIVWADEGELCFEVVGRVIVSIEGDGIAYATKRDGDTAWTAGSHDPQMQPQAAVHEINAALAPSAIQGHESREPEGSLEVERAECIDQADTLPTSQSIEGYSR